MQMIMVHTTLEKLAQVCDEDDVTLTDLLSHEMVEELSPGEFYFLVRPLRPKKSQPAETRQK